MPEGAAGTARHLGNKQNAAQTSRTPIMLCQMVIRKLPRVGCKGALDQNRFPRTSSPSQLSGSDYRRVREQRVKLSLAQTFVYNYSAFCAEGFISPCVHALWVLLSYRHGHAPFSTNGHLSAAPARFPSSHIWHGPRLGGVGRVLSSRARLCCGLVADHGQFFIGLRCPH